MSICHTVTDGRSEMERRQRQQVDRDTGTAAKTQEKGAEGRGGPLSSGAFY